MLPTTINYTKEYNDLSMKAFYLTILLFSISIKLLGFNFRVMNTKNGLTSNFVTTIFQDSKNNIWVGTSNGINRYYNTGYITYENSEIKNKIVNSIIEINNDKLLLGTNDGLWEFNVYNNTFKEIILKEENTIITTLTKDKSNYIWAGSNNKKVYKINPTTYEYSTYNINTHNGFGIIIDKHDIVWAYGVQGLFKFIPQDNEFEKTDIINQGIIITTAINDSYGNIWLGTWNDGIIKLNTKNYQTEYILGNTTSNIKHIHSICEYSKDIFFIGSDCGFSVLDLKHNNLNTVIPEYCNKYSISDKFVYPIIKDHEGGVWIGTYYGGVNYLPPFYKQFNNYTTKTDKHSYGKIISKFCQDNNNNLWIGSDDGGLHCFSLESRIFLDYKNQDIMNKLNVHALCIEKNDLWIGSYSNNIIKMNIKNGNLKEYDINSAYTIQDTKSGQIYAGSMDGVYMYDKSKDMFQKIKNITSTIIDIKEDYSNNLWFGTIDEGLLMYNPEKNKWNKFSKDLKNIGSNNINSIYTDNYKIIVGTSEGLFIYNSDNKTFNKVAENSISFSVNFITKDSGKYWITTEKGLIKMDSTFCIEKIYTENDGLQCDNFIATAGIKTNEGEIFVGTSNGFISFLPSNLHKNNNKPNINITKIETSNKNVYYDLERINNKTSCSMDKVTLEYDRNYINISFDALSYCIPEENNYAYMLEGFDKNWHYNDINKATYTNLPPKEYIFKVKASNNDNIWNEDGVSIKIEILPPFYLTLPFKILYFIAIILSVFITIKYIKKKSERKYNERFKLLSIEKEKEINEAKIEFFTNIAHEIRTPVSLIIAPLEKIMDSNEINNIQIKNDLDIIHRNSNRLLYLVNQLLDFRKAEFKELTMKYSNENIYLLVRSVTDRFLPLLSERGIDFNLICDDTNFTADIDKEAMTKVISNLMTNANKYTNNKIDITIENHTEEKKFSISVTDNGIGMTEDTIKHIFEPFYQAKSNKPGTGIGLCIVKGIIELHHGVLKVNSRINEGSSFTLELPMEQCCENSYNSSNKDDISSEIIDYPIKRNDENKDKEERTNILIVDDNIDMLDFLSSHLHSNYNILTATNGKLALETLKNNSISLVITDWMMPIMNGLELCNKIRTDRSICHIPIILLTAKSDINSKTEGIECGADDYIEKPFNISYLEAKIKSLIELRKQLKSKYLSLPLTTSNTVVNNEYDKIFLKKFQDTIEENFANPDLSIDFIADKLCISRSGLFAKIKGLVDITPNEMIQLIRLKKAALLIQENKYKMNEICIMVGFNNASYFSKCFQKQFGMRPIDFAAKVKNKSNNYDIDDLINMKRIK